MREREAPGCADQRELVAIIADTEQLLLQVAPDPGDTLKREVRERLALAKCKVRECPACQKAAQALPPRRR